MEERPPLPETDADEFRQPRPWLAWMETLVVTVSVLIAGRLWRPDDPFLLRSGYSWLGFAPLCAGVRYGFAHGASSAIGIIACLGAAWRFHLTPLDRFPTQFSLGLLLEGMLAGEFCDLWIRRLGRLDTINAYRRTRLTEFTRAYHLLKVSHDRIEQVFAGATHNLREAIMTMRRQLFVYRGTDDTLYGLQRQILSIFANYGWIQVAALFAVDEQGALHMPALDHIGEPFAIQAHDGLIVEALRTKQLVSVRPDATPEEAESVLLAAIPIVDVYGRVWALLAVRSMLFIAFHDENLRLLAILGGHLGDVVASGPAISTTRNLSVKEFLGHLRRSIFDRRRFELPVALLGITPKDQAGAELLVNIVVKQRRGLDQLLTIEDRNGRQAIFLLMPLTEESGVKGYLARLRANVARETKQTLEEAGISIESRLLANDDVPEAVLVEMRKRCGIDEEETARHISV